MPAHRLLAPLALALALTPFATRQASASWTPEGVAIAVYNCAELPTDAVSDGQGGMFVVWTDERNCAGSRVFVQHLLMTGEAAPGWAAGGRGVCPDVNGQSGSHAIADGAGGVIVVWSDARTGESSLFAQRVTPDGNLLWTANGVRICATTGVQTAASLLPDAAGGVIVAWNDRRRGLDDGPLRHHPTYDVYAQKLDAAGVAQWTADGVPVDTSGANRSAPKMVTDGATGALVTWNPPDGATHLQHLRANGSVALPANGVAIPGRFYGFQCADGAGGIISTFQAGPDTQEDLYAQRVDSSGAIAWPLDGVLVESAAFGQRPNAILADGQGGAFIASYDLRNGHDWDVYLQRIGSDGAVVPGWPANGMPVSTAPGFQIYPTMVPDGGGGVVMTWYDARDTLNAYDVYAQRIDGAAIAPGWTPGGVRLCGASGDQVEPLPVSDGSGGALVAWSDYRTYADVFAQRVSGAGIAGDTSPIGIGDRPAIALSLGHAVPNPVVRGGLAVSFSAPGAEPATLSLVDARGRIVVRRALAAASSGRVTFSGADLSRVASGAYVLRLEQSGHSTTQKVSILR